MGGRIGPGSGDAGASAVAFLARQPGHACFVAELQTAMAGGPAGEQMLETVLNDLVATGAAFLQHNYCPDPHFSDEDLRVVALIDPARPEGEREEAAQACAQHLWERWLATFLASHRCT